MPELEGSNKDSSSTEEDVRGGWLHDPQWTRNHQWRVELNRRHNSTNCTIEIDSALTADASPHDAKISAVLL